MMGYGCVIDGMEMSSYEPVKNPLWTRNWSHFSRQLAQSSAQKHYNAEDTALLYYIEAHRKRKGEKWKRKTESHRKPIEVPQISYRGPLTCRELVGLALR